MIPLPLLPFLPLLLLILLSLSFSPSPLHSQQLRTALFNQIFYNYDDQIRPNFNTSFPVQIFEGFRVNLIYQVDSKNELFSMDLFTRESWVDSRLTFDPSLWPSDQLGPLRIPSTQRIWKPDTFFYNAVSCSVADTLLTLTPQGGLTWTRHQNCQFHISFDLTLFPFDIQTLQLKRIPFAYNQNEVVLISQSPCYIPDPSVNYQNSLWALTSWDCQQNYFSFRSAQAPYTQVIADIYVARLWQNYIVKMILPMFTITLLSTLTYWIDPGSPPARVGGTVTLVLSIVTFNLVVSSELPKINYSTLLDWYVWYCFIFVVFAVAEFAFVNYILVSKLLPEIVARLTDDFCAYTFSIAWALSNLLFWPILGPAMTGFVSFLLVVFFTFNVTRTIYNYKFNKRGLAMVGWLKEKGVEYYRNYRAKTEKDGWWKEEMKELMD